METVVNEKKIINPEVDYFVVSLKHTNKTDKYITLWGPDNAGYCYSFERAGKYKGYEHNYHNMEGNIPIPIIAIPKKIVVKNEEGRHCISNNAVSLQFIRLYES